MQLLFLIDKEGLDVAKRLEPKQIDALHADLRAGELTYKQLMEKHGVAPSTLRAHRDALGLKARRRRNAGRRRSTYAQELLADLRAGLRHKAIKDKYHCSNGTYSYYLGLVKGEARDVEESGSGRTENAPEIADEPRHEQKASARTEKTLGFDMPLWMLKLLDGLVDRAHPPSPTIISAIAEASYDRAGRFLTLTCKVEGREDLTTLRLAHTATEEVALAINTLNLMSRAPLDLKVTTLSIKLESKEDANA
jgi:hypothetical protein